MLIEKLQKEHPVHWKNATAIRVLTLDAVAAQILDILACPWVWRM